MSCDGYDLGPTCKDHFPATVTSIGKLNDAVALKFVETFYSSLFAGGNVNWSFDNATSDASATEALGLHAHNATQVYLVGKDPSTPGTHDG